MVFDGEPGIRMPQMEKDYICPENVVHDLDLGQARSQDFTLGGGTELRGCTFFSKKDDLFLVVAIKTLAPPAAGSIFLTYLRPTVHFCTENCYFTE